MDKPLHVKVAEALGWTEAKLHKARPGTVWDSPYWRARRPDCLGIIDHVPRYDTDWSATGPLIERFGLVVYGTDRPWADAPSHKHIAADGETALVAVCNLILALHDAGKLRPTVGSLLPEAQRNEQKRENAAWTKILEGLEQHMFGSVVEPKKP